MVGVVPDAVPDECLSMKSMESVHDFKSADVASSGDADDAANPATDDLIGYAYATAINAGVPRLAHKMVTHNWGNKFAHLIGAVFADALQQETYDGVWSIVFML